MTKNKGSDPGRGGGREGGNPTPKLVTSSPLLPKPNPLPSSPFFFLFFYLFFLFFSFSNFSFIFLFFCQTQTGVGGCMDSESRCRHKNALIVQDDCSNWIQSYPMKTNETSETISRLQRFISPTQKLGRIYTDNSKEFRQDRQDLQQNQDTSTPHRSETKGVRKSRPQSARRDSHRTRAKRTTRRMVGLCPGRLSLCAQRQKFDGPRIPFGPPVEYVRNTAKDKSGAPSRRKQWQFWRVTGLMFWNLKKKKTVMTVISPGGDFLELI